MAKLKLGRDPMIAERPPVFTVRFVIALVAIALGIAWIIYYYFGAREGLSGKQHGIDFISNLGNWNYLIGFGLLFFGLIISAHPDTPLGRGRGVVVGMLGCFILGLVWICVYYITSNNPDALWVFNDLGQKNLLVGIGFMAVGFAFATRWE
ncbi:cell division protein CrgA [Nocardioides sp. Iso805N]|uniref:cell division protein CrgA n=1 Tax=Nocardioides sp. Iso805N TaxID=1283287 RepID=UPI00036A59B7|nr:cell division protein CrgA [Nocardioides sp. Iso805N]